MVPKRFLLLSQMLFQSNASWAFPGQQRSSQGRESIKNKIREELRKGINKDQILNPEDRNLLKEFITKITKELNE